MAKNQEETNMTLQIEAEMQKKQITRFYSYLKILESALKHPQYAKTRMLQSANVNPIEGIHTHLIEIGFLKSTPRNLRSKIICLTITPAGLRWLHKARELINELNAI